jgi:hypothetical protein
VEKGIASRMLQQANAMLALTYEVQTDIDGALVLDAYGTPQLVLDVDGQPIVLDSVMLGTLTRYVGLIDATRQVGQLLGFGPLDGAQYE